MILKYLSDTIKQEWNRYYNKNKLQYEVISVRYLDGDSKSLYYTDKLKDYLDINYPNHIDNNELLNDLTMLHFKHSTFSKQLDEANKFYGFIRENDIENIVVELTKHLHRSKGKLDIYKLPVSLDWYIVPKDVLSFDLEITKRFTSWFTDYESKYQGIPKDQVKGAEKWGEDIFSKCMLMGTTLGKLFKEVRHKELIPNVNYQSVSKTAKLIDKHKPPKEQTQIRYAQMYLEVIDAMQNKTGGAVDKAKELVAKNRGNSFRNVEDAYLFVSNLPSKDRKKLLEKIK